MVAKVEITPQELQAERQRQRANLLTGVSGGVQAVGSFLTGLSGYNSARARAAVYAANAVALASTIPFAQRQGEQQASILQQEAADFVSRQRAAMAANGIVVDQDTALEATIQSAGIGARQVAESLQASRNEIEQIRTRVRQQDAEAAQARREGTASVAGGLFGVANSLLGAASTISKTNQRYKLGG